MLTSDDIGRIGTRLAYSPVIFHDLACGWRLEHRSRRDLLSANPSDANTYGSPNAKGFKQTTSVSTHHPPLLSKSL